MVQTPEETTPSTSLDVPSASNSPLPTQHQKDHTDSSPNPVTAWNALDSDLTPSLELIDQLEQSVNADLKLVEPKSSSSTEPRAKEEL